jgi:beta-glucanase (GH16 family)
LNNNGHSIYTDFPNGQTGNQAMHDRMGQYAAQRFTEIKNADSSFPQVGSGSTTTGGGGGWSSTGNIPIDYAGRAYDNSNALIGAHRLSEINSSKPDLSAGFHVYGMKWESDGITIFFDGTAVGAKISTTLLQSYALYPQFELWYETDAALAPNSTDTPTGSGNAFSIDYIRGWILDTSTGSASSSSSSDARPVGFASSTWPLVFNEDFSGSALNSNLWIDHYWYEGTDSTPNYSVGNGSLSIFPYNSSSGSSSSTSSFHMGMHSNHWPVEGGSPTPSFHYGVFRDWDSPGAQDFNIWNSDGSINFSQAQSIYNAHEGRGAKILHVFSWVPQWASSNPSEANPRAPGLPGALAAPADWDAYEDYCYRYIAHFRDQLYAVEGWNEPYPNSASPSDGEWPQFTTMTPDQLAETQKRVYRAAKRVDPNLLVFSPAQAYVGGIDDMLSGKTLAGEPIGNFFDVLAWHPYNRSADVSGIGIVGDSLENEANQVRQILKNYGLNKPLADTEHGWLGGSKEGGQKWAGLSRDDQGRVLYETAKLAKDIGLLCVCYYAYEHQVNEDYPGQPSPGLIGNPAANPPVASWLERAYQDFDGKGTTTSTSASFKRRAINTDGKYEQKYGYFEAKMRLPIGRGCAPLFYLYSHAGDKRPEIDIMRAYSGASPDTGQDWADANLHPIAYEGIVWSSSSGQSREVKAHPGDLSTASHAYGCLWEPDGITFYFDGSPIGSKVATSELDSPMFMVVTLDFGGASGTANTSETPTGPGNALLIDSVRAWSLDSGAAGGSSGGSGSLSSFYDEVTVIKVRANDSSVKAILDNEVHTISADSNGVVDTYDGAQTHMLTFVGATDDTSNWTFTRVDGPGVASSLAGNLLKITSMSADTGYVDITAHKNGQADQTLRMKLIKSRRG